jgi:4'-phosphopantetheinyl transferase
LARGENSIPAGVDWLTPSEAARAAGLGFTKRYNEYLLRRLVAKHAVAMVTGVPSDPTSLGRIGVHNALDGAPYVLVDDAPTGLHVSISDRAGWAVCLVATANAGCDLELVEPRTDGFVGDFLTTDEQHYLAAVPNRDFATNLLWSAKESALKVLRTGLRRDTRSVEVAVQHETTGGWAPLSIRSGHAALSGWWRRDGLFVVTVVSREAGPPPRALANPGVLAAAAPVHSWLDRPLNR